MRGAARVRLAVGIAFGAALLALAGCGHAGAAAATDSALGWEGQALQSIGFASQDVAGSDSATATATQSPGPGSRQKGRIITRHKLVRFAFGRNALHGEAVVQTEDGTKTVVVQRGTVTAVDASTLSVKSADGFTLTWSFGDDVKVIKDRAQSSPSALAVGTILGVAGDRTGGTTTARLVVVPATK
jgi:hypothetical protein